jgi:hypothetical protein
VQAVEVERVQLPPALAVRLPDEAPAVEAEDIEDDVRDANVVAAHQHPLADQREVRASISVERNQFAVERVPDTGKLASAINTPHVEEFV